MISKSWLIYLVLSLLTYGCGVSDVPPQSQNDQLATAHGGARQSSETGSGAGSETGSGAGSETGSGGLLSDGGGNEHDAFDNEMRLLFPKGSGRACAGPPTPYPNLGVLHQIAPSTLSTYGAVGYKPTVLDGSGQIRQDGEFELLYLSDSRYSQFYIDKRLNEHNSENKLKSRFLVYTPEWAKTAIDNKVFNTSYHHLTTDISDRTRQFVDVFNKDDVCRYLAPLGPLASGSSDYFSQVRLLRCDTYCGSCNGEESSIYDLESFLSAKEEYVTEIRFVSRAFINPGTSSLQQAPSEEYESLSIKFENSVVSFPAIRGETRAHPAFDLTVVGDSLRFEPIYNTYRLNITQLGPWWFTYERGTKEERNALNFEFDSTIPGQGIFAYWDSRHCRREGETIQGPTLGATTDMHRCMISFGKELLLQYHPVGMCLGDSVYNPTTLLCDPAP